jgi:hypothetical protein
MNDVDNVLQHFGIPGMHWGRRSGKHTTPKISKKLGPVSEDTARKNLLKKKSIAEMSNSELKALNERLQLEKTYKELSKTDTSAGRKFVTDLLTGAAKQSATNYTAKIMTKGLELAVKKIIGI